MEGPEEKDLSNTPGFEQLKKLKEKYQSEGTPDYLVEDTSPPLKIPTEAGYIRSLIKQADLTVLDTHSIKDSQKKKGYYLLPEYTKALLDVNFSNAPGGQQHQNWILGPVSIPSGGAEVEHFGRFAQTTEDEAENGAFLTFRLYSEKLKEAFKRLIGIIESDEVEDPDEALKEGRDYSKEIDAELKRLSMEFLQKSPQALQLLKERGIPMENITRVLLIAKANKNPDRI